MSQNENDLLDSLLDSLSDDQEMEKKIDEFARNKERQRRIQRARETSEQFQQTYSSSAKSQKTDADSAGADRHPDSAGEPMDSEEDLSGNLPKTEESGVNIPDFVGASQGATIPLQSLPDSFQSTPADDGLDQTLPVLPADDSEATMRFSQPVSPRADYGTSSLEATRPISSLHSSHEQQTRAIPVGSAFPTDMPEDDSTRVFSAQNSQAAHDPQRGGTVRVSNDEIRSLLEKDEPILKREYIRDDDEDFDDYSIEPEERYRKPVRKKSHTRLYLSLGGIGLALAVLIGGGFAIRNFVDSSLQTSQNDKGFNRLLSWVSDYMGYDDKTKKKILDYKGVYDKLSAEQKQKINDTLFASTGKTFDELLAIAQKGDVPDASNENVANAEKKAQIKDQISSLEGDVRSLTADLNEATNRIAQAKAAYDNATNNYNAATNDVNACQNTLNALQSQLAAIPADDDLQAQITSLQNQVAQMITNTPPNNYRDPDLDSSTDTEHPGGPNWNNGGGSGNSSGNASNLEQRQALLQQIDELKEQLSSNAAVRQDYQLQIADAQTALQAAQDKVPEAKSEMDTAYGAWQAIKDSADPIQNQIDQKNAQIADLQNQLDAIQ